MVEYRPQFRICHRTLENTLHPTRKKGCKPRDSSKSGARYLLRDPISPPVTLSNNRRLSAAAVTCLDLRRLLVDAGDDLVGDAKLHFP